MSTLTPWSSTLDKSPLPIVITSKIKSSLRPSPSSPTVTAVTKVLKEFTSGSTFSYLCRYRSSPCSIKTNGNDKGLLSVGEVEVIHDVYEWHVKEGRKNKEAIHRDLINLLPAEGGRRGFWVNRVDWAMNNGDIGGVKRELKEELGLVVDRRTVLDEVVEGWHERGVVKLKKEQLADLAAKAADGDQGAMRELCAVGKGVASVMIGREVSKSPAVVGFDVVGYYDNSTRLSVRCKTPSPQPTGRDGEFWMSAGECVRIDGRRVVSLKVHEVLKVKRARDRYEDVRKNAKKGGGKKGGDEKANGNFGVGFKADGVMVRELAERHAKRLKGDYGIIYNAVSVAFGVEPKGLEGGKPRGSTEAEFGAFKDAVLRSCKGRHERRCEGAWRGKVDDAVKRAGTVFCKNVRSRLEGEVEGGEKERKADVVVGIDPGFRSGFKCAVVRGGRGREWMDLIDIEGLTEGMGSFDWMKGGDKVGREFDAVLEGIKGEAGDFKKVDFAIGTGTGGVEVTKWIKERVQKAGIDARFNRVSEDGASVWSTSKGGREEFKHVKGMQIEWLGAVSIGRRFVSPISEVLKIPPRSMGYGMYQHDVKEKDLETGLRRTVEDVVAERGVWVNYDTKSMLEYVPGLTGTVRERILQERPFKSREDMRERVKGMGKKMFENAAGFCRIEGGDEALDDTTVHSKDYVIARWLVRDGGKGKKRMGRGEIDEYRQREEGKRVLERAVRCAKALKVNADNEDLTVEEVMGVHRMLRAEGRKETSASLEERGVELPAEYRDKKNLAKLPLLQGLKGVVENMTDFGIFVDFGVEGLSGLVHTSKLGPRGLEGVGVGREVVVDIIRVEPERERVGLRRHLGRGGRKEEEGRKEGRKRVVQEEEGGEEEVPRKKQKMKKVAKRKKVVDSDDSDSDYVEE